MTEVLIECTIYFQVGDIASEKRSRCLAACEDQVNLVTETSSSFPNSETFHRREEFCLIIKKLLRTCSTVKAAALTDKYPYICTVSSFWTKLYFDLYFLSGKILVPA